MKKVIKLVAVVTLSLVVLGLLIGWGFERRAVVTSEALPCVELGGKLVCFDGQPAGEVVCEQTDATTILCTQSN